MDPRIALYFRPYPRIDSWYAMIDEAAHLGMPFIEGLSNMELAEPDKETAQKLRAYADEKSIRFCCLSCVCNFNFENTEAQIQRMMYGPTHENMPRWINTLKGNYMMTTPMGQGIMDLERYVTELEQAGYTGLYALEFSAPSDDSPIVEQAIRTLSNWIST